MMNEIELIIFAMEEELSSLIKRLNNNYSTIELNNIKLYEFTINNKKFIATKGKIGKVATAFHIGQLSLIYKIKKIYNLGTSGAYDSSLNIGDVVIATGVKYFDVDATCFDYELGQVPQCPEIFKCENNFNNDFSNMSYKVSYGLIASSDSFITKKNRELFPLKKVNPLCVEMEAGAIGQCAFLLNIPFVVIRSISDKIYQDDNNKSFDDNIIQASDNCVDVLLKIINF